MAINIPILSSLDTKGFDKAQREFKNLTTTSDRSAFLLKKAAIPAAAAMGAIGAAAFGAAKAAIEDQAAQVQLAGTLARTTGATDATIKSTENYIDKLSETSSIADDDLRPALQKLLVGTKSLSTAQDLLAVSLDIAASTGKDLDTVSAAMSKGFAGNTRALASLSPELKTMIKQGADFSDVLVVLKRNFGGAADEAANTAEGGFRKLKNALNETKENIGNALLPAIEAVTPLLVGMGKWAKNNAPVFVTIGLAVGAFATAITLANIALAAWKAVSIITTGVNWALSSSFTAVQVATGIGIAAALAGAAAFVIIKNKMDAARGAAQNYSSALLPVITNQKQLNEYVGPVASRDIKVFTGATTDYGNAVDKIKEKQTKAADAAKKLKDELTAAKDVLRGQFADALKKANEVLDTAVEKFDNYKKSVASSIESGFSFANAQKAGEENTKAIGEAAADLASAQAKVSEAMASTDPADLATAYSQLADAQSKLDNLRNAPTSFLDNLKKDATKVKNFGVLVNRLIAGGLSETALNQVIAAGADAGTAIAEELLGSADGILQANALTKDVQDIADAVGKNSALKFYQAGVDAGTNLVKGIQAVVDTYTIQLNAATTVGQVSNIGAAFNNETGGLMNPGGGPLDLSGINWADIFSGIQVGGLATLAEGGIVTGPTLAMIGEGGGPEAVIPLDRAGNFGMGGGDTNVNINVNGGDPNAVVAALRTYMRQNGSVPIRVSSP